MRHWFAFYLSTSVLAWTCFGQSTTRAEFRLDQVAQAAANSHSLFLDSPGRVSAIETFVKLVRIKGPSGQEEAVHEEIKRLLSGVGARPMTSKTNDPTAPRNLVTEIPASSALADQPGILLNAHIDTIASSTPELLAFDSATGDFYHPNEGDPKKGSSFGGDDRSAVAAIVEA